MELRGCLRIPVQCQFSYSGTQSGEPIAGQGTVVNLSRDGWAIESQHAVHPGMNLSLRVHLPGHDKPVAVEQATVLWAKGGKFGLRSIRMEEKDRQRLVRFVVNNMNRSSFVQSRFVVRLRS